METAHNAGCFQERSGNYSTPGKQQVCRKRLHSVCAASTITLLALMLVSCSRYDNARHIVDGDLTLVTLLLNVPSSPTRALDDAAEGAISRLDVLLFDANDKFVYRAIGSNIANGTPAETQKNFTVRLPQGTYRAVVLANAGSSMLSAYPLMTITSGPTRDDVLDHLAMELADKTHKWTADFSAIPMWGYKDDLVVSNTPGAAPEIYLTRAIARVDVSVGAAGTAGEVIRAKFELRHVYLYNYSRAGSIAPKVAGTGYNTATPHLPALADLTDAATSIEVEGPLTYDVPTAQKHAFLQEIYTFEAPAITLPPADGWENNACLVIGGVYDNGPESYYRVDFRSGNDPGPYAPLAVLRNHRYNVVIQDVNGHGHATPDAAYKSLPKNVVVNVRAWNEALHETVFDGQYTLSVDRGTLQFYSEGGAKPLLVSTDYGKWNVLIPDAYDWITVDPDNYTGNDDPKTVSASVAALDPTGSPREGYFDIIAGNLAKRVFVKQSDGHEASIAITNSNGDPITGLLFGAGKPGVPPAAQSFRVTWIPASVSLSVQAVPYWPPFAHASADPFAAGSFSDPSGSVEFTVQPPPNLDGVTRSTRLDFSATSGSERADLSLVLRQEPPTYVFSSDGSTLTLFDNFRHGTALDGLNTTNIPELSSNTAVTRLVIEGNIDPSHISGIKARQAALLPNLAHVSLPDFTGTIPAASSAMTDGAFSTAAWL